MPEYQAVIIPGPEVPTQIASLSGAWEGRWNDGRASVFILFQVEKDSARVLPAFGENSDYLPWHQWARAAIVPGNRPRLEWKINRAFLKQVRNGS